MGIKPAGSLPTVNMEFANREAELSELDAAARHGGLLVVFGRRRVGKTRLSQQLLDPAVLTRELPFGESVRFTKKTLYRGKWSHGSLRARHPSVRFEVFETGILAD